MQTFLPYADYEKTAQCLDWRRLGKQRVEAKQILDGKWPNHPACKMWAPYHASLTRYYNCIVREWIRRGYNNTMPILPEPPGLTPWWLGVQKFHDGHRSNLIRKFPLFYDRYDWGVPDDLLYQWPCNETQTFKTIVPKWKKEKSES